MKTDYIPIPQELRPERRKMETEKVLFYSTSTIVGYLMLSPFYT